MGLFSRSEPSPKSGRRNGSRAPASSDAQAGDLRGRARRRLIGALVLVVAAIIILPMLFDKSSNVDKAPVVAQVVIPSAPRSNPSQPADAGGDALVQDTLPAPQVIEPDSDGKPPASASNPATEDSASSGSQSEAEPEASKAEKSADAASGAKLKIERAHV